MLERVDMYAEEVPDSAPGVTVFDSDCGDYVRTSSLLGWVHHHIRGETDEHIRSVLNNLLVDLGEPPQTRS